MKVWFGVVLATIGLYMLCMTSESFSLSKGDFLVLICAGFFSLHILIIDYFSPKADGVRLSCIQFFVCGLISMIIAFIFEQPNLGAILSGWLPILLRGSLYLTDCGSEEYGSNGCIPDLKFRECIFCIGRMGNFESETKRSRVIWLRADVFGNYYGSAAGKSEIIVKYEQSSIVF